jgi:MFS family permease
VLVAVAMFAYGGCGLALAGAGSLALALVLLVPAGMGWLSCLSTLNAMVQLGSPSWMKSRIMALYQLSFFGVWSVGATVTGAIATRWGERSAIAAGSVGVIFAALMALRSRLPSSEAEVRAENEPASLRPGNVHTPEPIHPPASV